MIRRPTKKNNETAQGPSRDFAEMAERLNQAAVQLAAVAQQARALASDANAEAERLSASPPLAPSDIEDVIHHAADAAKDLVEHAVQAIRPITSPQGKAPQVSDKQDTNKKVASLSIDELRLIIENTFGAEADIKRAFDAAVVSRVRAVLEDVAKAEDTPFQDKLALFADVRALALEFEQRVTPKFPATAPRLWNAYKHLYAESGPYQFAHDTYGDAAKIAIMSDFKRTDPALHNAMYRWSAKNGRPPAHLDIARQAEKLRSGDTPDRTITWADVLASASEETRAILRAYYAQQYRSQRSRPA